MTPEPYVAIASYKRPDKVDTLSVVPFAYVWVPESQGAAYRRNYGDRVVTIPDAEDGNTSRKRNAILNRSPSEWTVILDDDITLIGYWQGDHHKMTPLEIEDLFWRMFMLSEELGVTLWGVNQNHDELIYHTYWPFNLIAPVLGPLSGHLRPSLRYDESVPAKEDYDFWLQTIRKHHRTLRANKYHYYHDSGKRAGGFVSMRSRPLKRPAPNGCWKSGGRKSSKWAGRLAGDRPRGRTC